MFDAKQHRTLGHYEDTSHVNGQFPDGNNLLFADSHVDWRPFLDPRATARTEQDGTIGAANGITVFWW